MQSEIFKALFVIILMIMAYSLLKPQSNYYCLVLYRS